VSITIGAVTPLILARSANSPPCPRETCTAGADAALRCRSMCETGIAGAGDLFGVAIADQGAGRSGEEKQDEQGRGSQHALPANPPFGQPAFGSATIVSSPASAIRAGNDFHHRQPLGALHPVPTRNLRQRSSTAEAELGLGNPSCRLRYTAFLCSSWKCETVLLVCASAGYNPVPALMIGLLRARRFGRREQQLRFSGWQAAGASSANRRQRRHHPLRREGDDDFGSDPQLRFQRKGAAMHVDQAFCDRQGPAPRLAPPT